MAPIQHDLYYMKDGVSFLVDDTLFRVPRYMLENTSPVFKAMLSDVKPDDDPIPLPKVTSKDFEQLLMFLYPMTPQVDTVSKPWDEDQWIAILRVATMWEMTEIRTVAMRLLSQIRCPFTKISLGREYGNLSWIKEGFITLCLRPEPLNVDEAVQLTKGDVIACAAAREEIRSRVLSTEGGRRRADWTHPSRQIGSRVKGAEHIGLGHLSNGRVVRQIVNSAFGFEHDEEDEEEVAESGRDPRPWWSLHDIKPPHVLWLTKNHDDGHQISSPGSIKEVKDIPDSASMLTVADIERHWIRSTLQRDLRVLKYVTPLSFSAIALSIGVLILMPHALA